MSQLNKQTETATVPPTLHHGKNLIGFARFAEVVLGSLEVGSLHHLLLHTGYERYDDLYSPQHMTASSLTALITWCPTLSTMLTLLVSGVAQWLAEFVDERS